MPHQFTDLLVEGTVAGTSYRKLFCYDITNVSNLRNLKARVLDDLKSVGVPVESASEVVLRNYILTDYERTPFTSAGAKSCALSDQDSWGSGHGKGCRLLAAEPNPRTPIGPADDSRHAMLAIASRQLFDRACGDGMVLPLEARVKPAVAQQANAAEAGAAESSFLSSSSSSGAQALSSVRGNESQPLDITVRDFRGRCHSVRICSGTSVSRLKTGIATALGCSVVTHWRLMYDGRPMDDELDLADYSIKAGALIEVQMTSQQGRLKASPAASSATSSDGKDAATSSNSGGSASNGGGGAKAGGAAAPNCGAPWASPVAKGAAAQVTVQVLLPCGRVVQLNRLATEDVPQFVCRVLEAEKALLEAPAAAVAAVAAGRLLLGVALPASQPRTGAATSGRELLPPSGQIHGTSGLPARRASGQLNGAVVGEKLLAVLLAAAAAVVMAMVAL